MIKYITVFILLLTTIFWLGSPAAAQRITIVGEVNDTFQIVADNEIYDVDVNPVGEELVLKYIAQKVKVVGELKESGELKIIIVESFEVVEE
jgi:hypothetical protein